MTDSTNTLSGKVAMVIGAGRGIGRAIALGYARAGARVVCVARTATEIETTAEEIQAFGGEALAMRADVTRLTEVERLFDETHARTQGLDILLYGAGAFLEEKTIEESDPRLWEQTLSVNLTGAYYCARTAIPYLRRRGGGKILFIGSGLGHKGKAEGVPYATAKAGLWMFTRGLAQEVWQDNISVNELIPGPVRTAMNSEETRRTGKPRIASEWLKTPEDVVPMALFLASQPLVGPTAQSFSLMRRDN
jgi:3-oxoacyl-[acyl-carrier protein] reductase